MLRQVTPSPDLTERVYQALLDAIVSGELAPGERLTQEQLADRLGVSRQPVLQSLMRLRGQGLIHDTETRRGIRIAPLQGEHLVARYRVRAALDGLAAASAAAKPRTDLMRSGRALIAAGRRAAASDDIAALVDIDLRFHEFIYEASGNPILTETVRPHWLHIRRAMHAFLRQPVSFEGVWREHEGILKAIVAGDAETAEQLSRSHCERSVDFLINTRHGDTHETQSHPARAV
jgi:DNA-binding GntR family transcriptional regulator